MIDKIFAENEGAFSDNTIRAYRADYDHYMSWCDAHGYEHLPCTDDVLSRYVIDMSEVFKPASIERRINCLSTLFNLCNLPNPTKGKQTRLAIKRLYRQKGRFQEQAVPLRLTVLNALQEVCDDTLAGNRDRLMLQLGYETMRRRSEIVSFRFEHLESLSADKHSLFLTKSKNDQYGHGTRIPVSRRLFTMINEWSERIDEREGPILRSVTHDGRVGKSLDGNSLSRILKRLQQKANLTDIPPLSGHSFRVGAAIDLLERGVPIYQIMLRGGWKSESSALKYLRSWQPEPMPFFNL